MTRTALVSGGTRGIGAAISKALKAADYIVAATYGNNDEAAKEFEEETGIPVYKWDVSNFTACQEGVAQVMKDLGQIDILVNNAGITRDTPFHKMAFDMWNDVIRTNLCSAFSMTQAVINSMRDNGFGRIINISSINGQKGQFGQVNYGAAKAGILGFTKALAAESASKGITVNAIAPGYIATEMVSALSEKMIDHMVSQIPVGRLGEAEEIAKSVLFLACETAGFITGSTLSINGGQHSV